MGYYLEVKSFIGEGCISDPVQDAVKSATKQADNYLDNRSSDDEKCKVVSTSTQIIGHGDYISYIITMVIEIHYSDVEEDSSSSGQI